MEGDPEAHADREAGGHADGPVGGRSVPPYLAIVPAAIGGLVLTAVLIAWVLTTFEIAGFARDRFDNLWWGVLAVSTSGLFALCGPMVLAMTYTYYRRRCHPKG
ncbi:hypothetical protein ACFV1N_44925 [Streptosporangium canum]|uniref:hypothetical protein n=1 Tax=Streptosporangium canum TaxID=324952 RepID=UPI0036C8B12D